MQYYCICRTKYVLDSNLDNTLIKQTHYIGGMVFENDTLQLIHHHEGRIIPQGTDGDFEYQYHLKDHLGNVRTSFTTVPKTESFTATLKEVSREEEEGMFNLSSGFITNAETHNHTPGGSKSLRLSGAANEIIGLASTLRVFPGDEVSLEAYATYVQQNREESDVNGNIAGAMINAFSQKVAVGLEGQFSALIEQALFAGGPLIVADQEEGIPNAYLNYILFNKNMYFVDYGFQAITAAAKSDGSIGGHEKLTIREIEVPIDGYMYIYVSNESQTLVDVFFDDLTIEHQLSPVIQADDYYPFGWTFNSYASGTENNYKFNQGSKTTFQGLEGKEFKTERQTELQVDMTKYRIYDYALGRWWQVDPLADNLESLSPYNGMDNNPIRYNDPYGDCPSCFGNRNSSCCKCGNWKRFDGY